MTNRCVLFLSFFLFFGLCNRVAAQVVSEVVIQDNKKTLTSYITKITELRVGQPLDSALLERDIVRLRREPAFAHAYYQVHKDGENFKVVYGVQENFTIIPYVNFYTTNEDEFAYRLGVFDFNLFGRGIGAGVFYQKDIFDSVGLDVRIPYLFNRHWGLTASFKSLVTLEPVFFNNSVAQYKYANTSYELGALYQINLKHRTEFALSFFNEDYQFRSGATSTSVPQSLNVDKYLFKFIYQYDAVKNYFQYFNGFRSTFNIQQVESTDSSLPSFTIWRNDFEFYLRVGKRGNWANRLRIGFSSNDESPFAPFAVDNNLNIRGVGNLIDRGTGAIVLNTEYRYSLIDKSWFVLQTNAFIDSGTWRNPGGDFSDLTDRDNFRVYPGVGLRFIHKKIFNTIFRIDYGVGITPNSTQGFVFGIGQYF